MFAPVKALIRTGLVAGLARRGYEVRAVTPTEPEDLERERFDEAARTITRRHGPGSLHPAPRARLGGRAASVLVRRHPLNLSRLLAGAYQEKRRGWSWSSTHNLDARQADG